MRTAPPQPRPGGWKYTHQVGITRDVRWIYHLKIGNRKKPSSLILLALEDDGSKAHISVPQVLFLSYLIQWMPCFALGLVVEWVILLGYVGMEVTGSRRLVLLESFNKTLFRNLVHLEILDVKVLVKICQNLVHSWVRTWDILINFPWAGRVHPHCPHPYIFLDRRIAYFCCCLHA